VNSQYERQDIVPAILKDRYQDGAEVSFMAVISLAARPFMPTSDRAAEDARCCALRRRGRASLIRARGNFCFPKAEIHSFGWYALDHFWQVDKWAVMPPVRMSRVFLETSDKAFPITLGNFPWHTSELTKLLTNAV
jgi:hypothetical protein